MEKEEFETVSSLLRTRQGLREIDYQFGLNRTDERIDRADIIEALGEAYTGLVAGIYENVRAWVNGEGPLLQKVVTPTAYINGVVTNTKTEYLLSSHNYSGDAKQPEYVVTYLQTRGAVYEELLQESLQTGDMGPLLSVIETYQEPTLARRLYSELHRRKERYPDMIIGDSQSILRRIDSDNRRTELIKQTVSNYAITTAQKEYKDYLSKELKSDDTGILKSLLIGIRAKYFMPRRKSQWIGIFVEDRLKKIMRLPSVPEQLIAREKQGLVPAGD